MLRHRIGLGAVGLSAIAAIASVALPAALAQSTVMLTPKQASLARISVAPESAPDYEVSNLIVKMRAPTSDVARAMAGTNMRALSSGAGINMKSVIGMSGGASVVALEAPMSLSAARAVAARLAADPAVEYAEPDIVFKPSALPNDTELPLKQWNWAAPLDMYTGAVQVTPAVPDKTELATGGINMAAAWDLPVGSNEVVIAIIDTGIINHPDLNGSSALGAYVPQAAGGRFLAGYDFISANALGLAAPGVENNDGVVGRDPNPTDPGDAVDANTKNTNAMCYENKRTANNFATPNTWHGTRTAGIIAAIADNTSGMAGIASKANIKILPVRALGRCGGQLSDIVDAITWASGGPGVTGPGLQANATPAKVINVGAASAPGIPCPQPLQDAITAAIGRGAVVVAPTGNNYALDISAPANCSGVIAVTAHAINGESAQYTNIGPESKQGPNPTLSAPGGGRPASLDTLDDAIDNPRWAGFSIWSTGRDGANVLGIVRANNPNAAGEEAAYMFSGTSDAAAQVSAAAALVLAKRNATPAQVKDVLTTSARPFPALAKCGVGNVWAGQCGSGMLDVLRAIQATDPPVVVTPPANVTVAAGGTASFTVEAIGAVSYQWVRAGVAIAGATGPTYTTPPLAATDNNVAFQVNMSNSFGGTTSPAAVVTVTSTAANSPSGGGALPTWQLLLLSALLLAARVRVAYREQ